ncbi:copper chaperone PCu(A)C [Fodinicurvata sp. EGI_FJ10296]|uniref:copper chaperone PCu(A)C n=1 Tax=Fodinicurvata sp. EGI_FJ10296 TaxID=3231908 RepID=UPI0034547B84
MAIPRFALLAAVGSVVTALASVQTLAASGAGLSIEEPWARATAPNAPTGAVYVSITNTADEADRLTGAEGDVAERIELHDTEIDDDGVMRMREIDGGIPLPPGETVELAPQGQHIMLIGLDGPLIEGESFPLTLSFEQGDAVTVEVNVESIHGRSNGNGHGGN